jgi:Dolichyl-phosphate-mannose-protein mannosyltransferase
MIYRLLGKCIFLQLLLITSSIVLLVQPGGFGNADALFRYQATRSFWTDEPAVIDSQIQAGFTLPGKDGRRYNWFGLGHAAWMLPFDLAGGAGARLAVSAFKQTPESADQLRRLFVACGSNLATSLVAVASTYWLILGLGGNRKAAGLTGLLLLLGTSFLHYAQIAQENNLMMALTVLALAITRHAIINNNSGWMVATGFVLGAGLTIRIPFGLQIVCIVAISMLWRAETSTPQAGHLRTSFMDCLRMAPGLALGVVADRIYHVTRFGSWKGTYMTIFREQRLAEQPDLPANFPFHIDLIPGLKASVLSWDKLPFIYDPLALPALILPLLMWRHFPKPFRPFFVGALFLILGSVAFHARYLFGDTGGSWGPRYVVTSMQLVVVAAIPFIATMWKGLNPAVQWLTGVLVAAAISVQLMSVCFTSYLETSQRNLRHESTPVIVIRTQNVISLLAPDGLTARVRGRATVRDATPNFAAFVLSQKDAQPGGPSRLKQIWMVGVVLAFFQTLFLVASLFMNRAPETSPGPLRILRGEA